MLWNLNEKTQYQLIFEVITNLVGVVYTHKKPNIKIYKIVRNIDCIN
jgi:hypothetical protein